MRGAREAHLTLDRASVSSSDDWESDRRHGPAAAQPGAGPKADRRHGSSYRPTPAEVTSRKQIALELA